MLSSVRSLARHAREDGTRMALRGPDLELTFGELAVRVGGFLTAASDLPDTVGLMAENSVAWAIADLGLSAAGRTLVPLPPQFSDQQLGHIARDSGVEAVLADAVNAGRAAALGAPVRLLDAMCARAGVLNPDMPAGPPKRVNRIIYTSGTTGAPKGVRLGTAQVDFMARALAGAVGATRDDRYMSVLPLAMLLEQFGAIHVPALVGGESCLVPSVAGAVGRGQPGDIAGAARAVRPTFTVIVPALLRLWMAGLAPGETVEGLRHVAVGGAHTAPRLIGASWQRGIPVHEGYGLSECCSVVALNRPGENRPGTVGRPLDGIEVEIAADGEIVVSGPSVMTGYLGAADIGGRWATGDLGSLDEAGRLTIRGRRDTVLVTEFGRNVSPEWIESLFMADPRAARSAVTLMPGTGLTALIGLTEDGEAWAREAGDRAGDLIAAQVCADAPEYARPRAGIARPAVELMAAGVLQPGGRIDRRLATSFAETILGHGDDLALVSDADETFRQEAV